MSDTTTERAMEAYLRAQERELELYRALNAATEKRRAEILGQIQPPPTHAEKSRSR